MERRSHPGALKVNRETEEEATYRIDRCYEDGRPRETQREGLTREEAMEHCQSPDTEGEGWFDAFYEE